MNVVQMFVEQCLLNSSETAGQCCMPIARYHNHTNAFRCMSVIHEYSSSNRSMSYDSIYERIFHQCTITEFYGSSTLCAMLFLFIYILSFDNVLAVIIACKKCRKPVSCSSSFWRGEDAIVSYFVCR